MSDLGGGNPQIGDGIDEQNIEGGNDKPKSSQEKKDHLEDQEKKLTEIKKVIDQIKSGDVSQDNILKLQELVKGLDISILKEPLKSLVLNIIKALENKKHNEINSNFQKLLGVGNEVFDDIKKTIGENIAKITKQEFQDLEKKVQEGTKKGFSDLLNEIASGNNSESFKEASSGLINSMGGDLREKMEKGFEEADFDKNGELTQQESEKYFDKEIENQLDNISQNETINKIEKTDQNIDNNLEKNTGFDVFEKIPDNERGKKMKELLHNTNTKEKSKALDKRNQELENGDRTENGVVGLTEAFENCQNVVNNITQNIYNFPIVGPIIALGITRIRNR